jgi:hypothetical protein
MARVCDLVPEADVASVLPCVEERFRKVFA